MRSMGTESLMSTRHVMEDIVVAIAMLNLVVSIAIAISSAYVTRQKVLQILIVWIVPLLGGVLFGLFILSQRENTQSARDPSENPDNIQGIWTGLLHHDDEH